MTQPAPLTDLQFQPLLPHILPRSPGGRQIGDLRGRMDAIFHVASGTGPWAALPARFGRPDTVSRYFRRLTQGGLWPRLLRIMKDCSPDHPLREIAPLIFRACRRAARILGLGFIALVRRLRLFQALPGPPAKVADPDLSETMRRRIRLPPPPRAVTLITPYIALLRDLRRLHRRAGGVAYLPRALRLGWS